MDEQNADDSISRRNALDAVTRTSLVNFDKTPDDADANRQNVTSDGPVVTTATPDRRGVLKRAATAAIAALGLPLFGGRRARGASDDELLDYYSESEHVQKSVADNWRLVRALGEIGIFDEGYKSRGLQVSAVTVDDERVPEHRLFAKSRYGMVSTVVSPDGVPLGGYAKIVTTEEKMEESPFEWPLDKMGELADGRKLFRVEPDGWSEVVQAPGGLGDPTETWCGTDLVDCRPSWGECWMVGCCGVVERTGPCGDSSSERREACKPCRANPNEECTEDSPWNDPCDHYAMCHWEERDDGERVCSCIADYPDYYGC